MATTGPDFSKVPLDTGNHCDCSPDVADDFRGIRIVAPAEVRLSKRVDAFPINEPIPNVPVCGTVNLPAAFANQFHSYWHEMTLVAVNARTHEAYSANLLTHDLEPSGGRKVSHPNLDEVVIGSWFNMNLFQKMEALPWVPATYDVWATLGEVRSNVIQVKVQGEPSAPRHGHAHPGTPLLHAPAAEPLLSFEPTAGLQPLPSSFRGVEARASVDATQARSSLVLHGRFQFGAEDAKELGGPPLARALVLTVTSGLSNEARQLVRDEALFPDDEQAHGGIHAGHFRYRLGRALVSTAPGVYYLTVSMGRWLSNTWEVRVDGGKAVVVEHGNGAARPR